MECTRIALELNRRDLTNRVSPGPVCTGRVLAAECADRELEMDGAHPPREVREMVLIAIMDRRGRHGTVRAGGGRRRGCEMELPRRLPHGRPREAHDTGSWEYRGDECMQIMRHNRI